jgi:hypothetical protein
MSVINGKTVDEPLTTIGFAAAGCAAAGAIASERHANTSENVSLRRFIVSGKSVTLQNEQAAVHLSAHRETGAAFYGKTGVFP